MGSDEPWVLPTGRPQNNIFTENTMIGGGETIKLTTADGTEFIDNTFEDAETVRFEDCEGTLMSGNTGLDGVEMKVTEGSCFANGTDPAYTPTC
ncbi:unnamed protein product [Scytosiphon promiscuus]